MDVAVGGDLLQVHVEFFVATGVQLEAGEEVGVLSGVPITVKVNVDQIGRATTNGVRLQKDLIAKTDNPVVKNLRNAGILNK